MICEKHNVTHRAFDPCPGCLAEIVAMGPDAFDALHPEVAHPVGPSAPDNASGQLAERAIEAIKKAFAEEFKNDPEWPQVTLVVSVPPDGMVVVASTEHESKWILAALKAGWGAIHRAVRLAPNRN